MILLLVIACGDRSSRFTDDHALQRSLAAIDRDRNGSVEVGELPDPSPDRDGDGTLSVAELREALDVDPWSVHADEIEGAFPGPSVRPDKTLARDVDHASRVVVRDTLRFLRRELSGAGQPLPNEELVLRAAGTGRLDSVPSKDAMAMFREAAIANGTPLPNPR